MKSKDYLIANVYLSKDTVWNSSLIDKCKIKSLIFEYERLYINAQVDSIEFYHYNQYDRFITYIIYVDNIDDLLKKYMTPSGNNDKYNPPRCISIEFIDDDINTYTSHTTVCYHDCYLNMDIYTNNVYYDGDAVRLLNLSDEEKDNITKNNVLSAVNALLNHSNYNDYYDNVMDSMNFISIITAYISTHPCEHDILYYMCKLIKENEELVILFNTFIQNITGTNLDTVIRKILNS